MSITVHSFVPFSLCTSRTPSGISCLKLEISLTDFYFYIAVGYFVTLKNANYIYLK